MVSQILPISDPSITESLRASSSSTMYPMSAAAAGTMLLRSAEEDLPTTRLLISPQFEDEKKTIEVKPLLSRASSFNSTTTTPTTNSNYQQKRRRRTNSETSISIMSDDCSKSFRQDGDAYLITRLTLKLLRYLGIGYRWIMRFLALGCYSFLIFPGFLQVAYYYFFSSQVRRGIVYGDHPRNRLDLYLPKNSDGPKPVVAFVTGGAWIIGYKAWGSLLGQQLSERDIIVACIDYRNYPQATISDMVKDSSQGISFVCNNIAEYGGDPSRIYLMGQSAGAHIAACTLLEQAIKELGEGESTSWSVSQIKTYFGLSGGYNLLNLVDHFHSRGLYRSVFLSIMEGEQSLQRFSPEVMVQDPNIRNAVSLLPPIVLFHGTGDYSIPSDSSKNFADTLQRVGVKAESILYEGKSHTDVFLQDPMRGGKDELFEDLVAIIHEGDSEALAKDAVAAPRKRLVPEFMLKLASRVSPF
ncbi:probable isoprenylcysteine alpha-carbonyl methylesterase ICMEL1 [Cornus florida]|uniref:probable isoprenylcysteine alpha-carbonyl methylesterase ICMEL1 n=1 Tax=Cornus florida TaxID=4283 RepID=UPI00289C6FC7|nr:probable isoprenylcysteine alpha-carbonyl methylesterase ICMEL1 [Cornus florida]